MQNAIGQKIKVARIACGMTQRELSQQSDIPLRTIEEWESGRRNLNNIGKIKILAQVLKLKLEDLI